MLETDFYYCYYYYIIFYDSYLLSSIGLFKIMSSFIGQIANSGEACASSKRIFCMGRDYSFFSLQQMPTLMIEEASVVPTEDIFLGV